MRISIKPIHSQFKLPTKATDQSAGYDLYACLTDSVVLSPFKRALIPTGFCIELEPNTEAQIRPRSGLAFKHGITVLNSPGTIDADYRGEVKIMLINLGNEDFTIENGMRIAQMICAKVEDIAIDVVEELTNTNRGTGGFGSTGRK